MNIVTFSKRTYDIAGSFYHVLVDGKERSEIEFMKGTSKPYWFRERAFRTLKQAKNDAVLTYAPQSLDCEREKL